MTSEIAESIGLKSAKGAIVVEPMPGTPAVEAGLKSGDVITALNGKAVEDAADLTLRIGVVQAGRQGRSDLYARRRREDRSRSRWPTRRTRRSRRLKTRNRKKDQAAPSLGIQIAPAKEVAGSGDKGVAIVNVDPNGAAAAQGLTAGDVILDVAGKPVSTPQDVKSQVASAKSQGKKAVLMRIQTADGDRYVAVPFPKA